MPYLQNKPEATDQLDDSQGDIQGNFQEIYNLVGVNHVQFGVAGQGKHTQVTLPENVAPTPTAINEANIYSSSSILTGVTELFWQRENNGSVIPFTAFDNIGGAGGSGWSYLPSGLIIKWGTEATNNVPTNILFETPPIFNTVFSVVYTVQSVANINAVVSAVLPAQFTVSTFTANTGAAVASTISYFAIGI